MHLKLQESATHIVGIDISDDGLSILHRYGIKNIKKMDAEHMVFSQKYDIILAGDVLEHMNNTGLFLEKAVSLLNQNGEIVIAVPSAFTINNLKVWFLGRELVHRDHTYYFSPKTISSLCARFGLLPVKLIFTVQSEETHESKVFVNFRKTILTLFNMMSPSFIMHFKKVEEVESVDYYEWK